MEQFYPSEIARLVLGYLKEVKCSKSWQTFLQESADLHEYYRLFKEGKSYPTNVYGKSLLDILKEYSILKNEAAINEQNKSKNKETSDSRNFKTPNKVNHNAFAKYIVNQKMQTQSVSVSYGQGRHHSPSVNSNLFLSPTSKPIAKIPKRRLECKANPLNFGPAAEEIYRTNEGKASTSHPSTSLHISHSKENAVNIDKACYTNSTISSKPHFQDGVVQVDLFPNQNHLDVGHTSIQTEHSIIPLSSSLSKSSFEKTAQPPSVSAPAQINDSISTFHTTSTEMTQNTCTDSSSSTQLASSSSLNERLNAAAAEVQTSVNNKSVVYLSSEITAGDGNITLTTMESSVTPHYLKDPPPYNRAPETNSPRIVLSLDRSQISSLTTPMKVKKDWTEEFCSPKRKGFIPRRRLLNESAMQNQMQCPETVPMFASIHEDLATLEEFFSYPPLAEKIAENINKEMSNEELKESDGSNSCPALRDIGSSEYFIKSVSARTQADPIFDEFLSMMCNSRDCCEGNISQDSSGSKVVPIHSNSKNSFVSQEFSLADKETKKVSPLDKNSNDDVANILDHINTNVTSFNQHARDINTTCVNGVTTSQVDSNTNSITVMDHSNSKDSSLPQELSLTNNEAKNLNLLGKNSNDALAKNMLEDHVSTDVTDFNQHRKDVNTNCINEVTTIHVDSNSNDKNSTHTESNSNFEISSNVHVTTNFENSQSVENTIANNKISETSIVVSGNKDCSESTSSFVPQENANPSECNSNAAIDSALAVNSIHSDVDNNEADSELITAKDCDKIDNAKAVTELYAENRHASDMANTDFSLTVPNDPASTVIDVGNNIQSSGIQTGCKLSATQLPNQPASLFEVPIPTVPTFLVPSYNQNMFPAQNVQYRVILNPGVGCYGVPGYVPAPAIPSFENAVANPMVGTPPKAVVMPNAQNFNVNVQSVSENVGNFILLPQKTENPIASFNCLSGKQAIVKEAPIECTNVGKRKIKIKNEDSCKMKKNSNEKLSKMPTVPRKNKKRHPRRKLRPLFPSPSKGTESIIFDENLDNIPVISIPEPSPSNSDHQFPLEIFSKTTNKSEFTSPILKSLCTSAKILTKEGGRLISVHARRLDFESLSSNEDNKNDDNELEKSDVQNRRSLRIRASKDKALQNPCSSQGSDTNSPLKKIYLKTGTSDTSPLKNKRKLGSPRKIIKRNQSDITKDILKSMDRACHHAISGRKLNSVLEEEEMDSEDLSKIFFGDNKHHQEFVNEKSNNDVLNSNQGFIEVIDIDSCPAIIIPTNECFPVSELGNSSCESDVKQNVDESSPHFAEGSSTVRSPLNDLDSHDVATDITILKNPYGPLNEIKTANTKKKDLYSGKFSKKKTDCKFKKNIVNGDKSSRIVKQPKAKNNLPENVYASDENDTTLGGKEKLNESKKTVCNKNLTVPTQSMKKKITPMKKKITPKKKKITPNKKKIAPIKKKIIEQFKVSSEVGDKNTNSLTSHKGGVKSISIHQNSEDSVVIHSKSEFKLKKGLKLRKATKKTQKNVQVNIQDSNLSENRIFAHDLETAQNDSVLVVEKCHLLQKNSQQYFPTANTESCSHNIKSVVKTLDNSSVTVVRNIEHKNTDPERKYFLSKSTSVKKKSGTLNKFSPKVNSGTSGLWKLRDKHVSENNTNDPPEEINHEKETSIEDFETILDNSEPSDEVKATEEMIEDIENCLNRAKVEMVNFQSENVADSSPFGDKPNEKDSNYKYYKVDLPSTEVSSETEEEHRIEAKKKLNETDKFLLSNPLSGGTESSTMSKNTNVCMQPKNMATKHFGLAVSSSPSKNSSSAPLYNSPHSNCQVSATLIESPPFENQILECGKRKNMAEFYRPFCPTDEKSLPISPMSFSNSSCTIEAFSAKGQLLDNNDSLAKHESRSNSQSCNIDNVVDKKTSLKNSETNVVLESNKNTQRSPLQNSPHTANNEDEQLTLTESKIRKISESVVTDTSSTLVDCSDVEIMTPEKEDNDLFNINSPVLRGKRKNYKLCSDSNRTPKKVKKVGPSPVQVKYNNSKKQFPHPSDLSLHPITADNSFVENSTILKARKNIVESISVQSLNISSSKLQNQPISCKLYSNVSPNKEKTHKSPIKNNAQKASFQSSHANLQSLQGVCIKFTDGESSSIQTSNVNFKNQKSPIKSVSDSKKFVSESGKTKQNPSILVQTSNMNCDKVEKSPTFHQKSSQLPANTRKLQRSPVKNASKNISVQSLHSNPPEFHKSPVKNASKNISVQSLDTNLFEEVPAESSINKKLQKSPVKSACNFRKVTQKSALCKKTEQDPNIPAGVKIPPKWNTSKINNYSDAIGQTSSNKRKRKSSNLTVKKERRSRPTLKIATLKPLGKKSNGRSQSSPKKSCSGKCEKKSGTYNKVLCDEKSDGNKRKNPSPTSVTDKPEKCRKEALRNKFSKFELDEEKRLAIQSIAFNFSGNFSSIKLPQDGTMKTYSRSPEKGKMVVNSKQPDNFITRESTQDIVESDIGKSNDEGSELAKAIAFITHSQLKPCSKSPRHTAVESEVNVLEESDECISEPETSKKPATLAEEVQNNLKLTLLLSKIETMGIDKVLDMVKDKE